MTMKDPVSADGLQVHEGQTVWIRIGNPYPRPGTWRCRRMVIDRIKRTGKLVLRPTKGRTGCERQPDQVFLNEQGAKHE
jgi:hypothetical protein